MIVLSKNHFLYLFIYNFEAPPYAKILTSFFNVFFKGYDDRRPHRDRSWEGRSGSIDRERGYMHPHKDWDNEDYRSAEWGRDRHWPLHEPQVYKFYLLRLKSYSTLCLFIITT